MGKHDQPEVYVSFIGEDKRLDTWVLESQVGEEVDLSEPGATSAPSQAALVQVSLLIYMTYSSEERVKIIGVTA